MADNWSDNYDTRYGVDPSDYESEDDFLSARMSARGVFNTSNKDNKKQDTSFLSALFGNKSGSKWW